MLLGKSKIIQKESDNLKNLMNENYGRMYEINGVKYEGW
jgi:hypothetical protein